MVYKCVINPVNVDSTHCLIVLSSIKYMCKVMLNFFHFLLKYTFLNVSNDLTTCVHDCHILSLQKCLGE